MDGSNLTHKRMRNKDTARRLAHDAAADSPLALRRRAAQTQRCSTIPGPTDAPFANRTTLHHASTTTLQAHRAPPSVPPPPVACAAPCCTAPMGLLMSSLWRRLFTFKEFKVCLVGLDNAGKTTILFQLCVKQQQQQQ